MNWVYKLYRMHAIRITKIVSDLFIDLLKYVELFVLMTVMDIL